MTSLTTIFSTVTAAFLASLVEVVEAFTIVLAVGLTQSWPPAFIGSGLALIVLAALVAVFGPLLGLVPIHVLQFAVGALLILFGMRWLRKAMLRSIGVLALHDEEKAFAKETEALARAAREQRAQYLAGLAAFKAVLLEGTEVVFIVIAVGTTHGLTLYASLGAFAAFIVVHGGRPRCPSPAVASAGEHAQIRRRPDADHLRRLLDRRRPGRRMAGRRPVALRHLHRLRRRIAGADALAQGSARCRWGTGGGPMNVLTAIAREVAGLFIDDGALALLSLVLIAIVAGLVELAGLPALLGALALLVGCLLILADSVRRGCRGK